jgi:hypothetical protein
LEGTGVCYYKKKKRKDKKIICQHGHKHSCWSIIEPSTLAVAHISDTTKKGRFYRKRLYCALLCTRRARVNQVRRACCAHHCCRRVLLIAALNIPSCRPKDLCVRACLPISPAPRPLLRHNGFKSVRVLTARLLYLSTCSDNRSWSKYKIYIFL